MTILELNQIYHTVNILQKVFGLEKEFSTEYNRRHLEIGQTIIKELTVEKSAYPRHFADLPPKSAVLAQGLKKWIAENYKFPIT